MHKITLLTLLLMPFITVTDRQTFTHFTCTETTTASPEKIWQIWTDVPHWPQWDTGLRTAQLTGDFTDGAKGKLVPDKGTTAKFIIEDLKINSTYTFKTKIPFGWLKVKRTVWVKSNLTFFSHEVWFTGPLKNLFGKIYGRRYRELLPEVLKNIKKIAEN